MVISWLFTLSIVCSAGATPARVPSLINKARGFEKKGQIERALITYEKVLELEHKNPVAIKRLGLLYIARGLFKRAADRYKKIVQEVPSSARAWYVLAFAQRRTGDCPGALASLARYSQLKPADGEPYYAKGRCLEKLSRTREARAAYETYLKMGSPSGTFATKARAAIRRLTAPKTPRPATRPVTPPAQRPASVALLKKAKARYRAGDKRGALALLHKGLRAQSGDYLLLTGLAALTLEVGRCKEALPFLEAGTKKFATSKVLLWSVAWCRRRVEQYGPAVRAYEAYLKVFPGSPSVLYWAAETCYKMGRLKCSLKYYKAYLVHEKRPGQERWIKVAKEEVARIYSLLGFKTPPAPKETPVPRRRPVTPKKRAVPEPSHAQVTAVCSLLSKGLYAKGLRASELLTRQYPKSGRAHALRGEALFVLGRYTAAEAASRKAMVLSPRVATPYRVRGLILIKQRYKVKALAALKQFLSRAVADPYEAKYIEQIQRLVTALGGE